METGEKSTKFSCNKLFVLAYLTPEIVFVIKLEIEFSKFLFVFCIFRCKLVNE